MEPNQHKAMAARKTEDILGAIHYDTTSLTHALIRAFRHGMPAESGHKAFDAIAEACAQARVAFDIAVAMPEQKAAVRPKVDL